MEPQNQEKMGKQQDIKNIYTFIFGVNIQF